MSPDAIRALLSAMTVPAAWADSSGQIAFANLAFDAWATSYRRASVEEKPDGAWLVALGRAPMPVRAEPLGDGQLVLSAGDGGRVALDAVVTNVVRRLDRVVASVDSTLSAALRERPSDRAVAAIREALSAVEELRGVRRQVLGLAPGVSRPEPQALNLATLTEEALAAMTGPLPIEFGTLAQDCIVRAVREKGFWALAALVGSMSRRLPSEGRIRIDVRTRSHHGQVVLAATNTATEGAEIESARDAVEAAGGRVLIDPDSGVVVEFPLFDTVAAERPSASRGPVLVVDDDPGTLAMMGAVLRRDGFAVMEAENGVAASMILRTHGRSLVALVTDAVLPGRSGVDLAGEARRSLPSLPILIVTGHDEDLVGTSLAPILRKPFQIAEFRAHVQALFSAKGQEP